MAQRPRLASYSRHLGPQLAGQLSSRSHLLASARNALTGHLSVSSRLLRLVVDSLAEGVVVANLEGRFVLFNPAAERILSLGFRDVPLQDWSSVYGTYKPDMVSPFPAEELPLARSLRGEVVDDCEIFIRRNRRSRGRLDQRQQPAGRGPQRPHPGRRGDVPRHHGPEAPARAPPAPLEDRRGHGRRGPRHRQCGEHRVRQRRVRGDDGIHQGRSAGQEPQAPQVRPSIPELLRGSLGESAPGRRVPRHDHRPPQERRALPVESDHHAAEGARRDDLAPGLHRQGRDRAAEGDGPRERSAPRPAGPAAPVSAGAAERARPRRVGRVDSCACDRRRLLRLPDAAGWRARPRHRRCQRPRVRLGHPDGAGARAGPGGGAPRIRSGEDPVGGERAARARPRREPVHRHDHRGDRSAHPTASRTPMPGTRPATSSTRTATSGWS